MSVSRRTALVAGAAAVAAAAVGTPVAVLSAPKVGFRLLSPREVVLVSAIGEALFPPGNPLGVCAADVGIARRVDDLLADVLDPVVAPVFRYLLRGFDLGTLVSRQQAFEALSLPERRDVLDTWSDDAVFPRRLGYDTFKLIFGMAFFDTPPVRAAVGYDMAICHLGDA
jgi:hypothetical protein